MAPTDFFRNHSVFRREEFAAACYPTAAAQARSVARALAHHSSTGRILQVRRGLYAVAQQHVPGEHSAGESSFLIAAKLAPDAILAYHTALEYLGSSYSLRSDRTVLTATKAKGFEHQGVEYRVAAFPKALDTNEKRLFAVEEREEMGVTVRVTSLERTLVDLLDRPDLAGGWEELWRSFEAAGFVDPKVVVQHTENLANATTAARVGWFLEQHRERWMIPEQVLERVEKLAPASPRYLLRSQRKGGTLLKRWNLIVPESVATRQWEEVL